MVSSICHIVEVGPLEMSLVAEIKTISELIR